MKYELAKELKDVGFPQKRISETRIYGENRIPIGVSMGVPPRSVKAPTLSELIEACGGEVFLTNCHGFVKKYESKLGWVASKSYGVEKPEDLGDGKTPEEAVARLWLALNNNANKTQEST